MKPMSKSDRWIAIVNPNAAGAKLEKDWPYIHKLLKESDIDVETKFTTHRYHAVELTVMAIREGYRHILSVGGDGTLHEVVNGIFMQKEIPVSDVTVANIPAGSGNDWGRMYGVPSDYADAVKIVRNQKTILQDIGKITYTDSGVRSAQYMVNIAGVGLDASICKRCNHAKNKGQSSKFSYIKAAFAALIFRRSVHSEIIIDNKTLYKGKVFSTALGVGRYSGGGMKQLPDALCDDGLLNIMVAKDLPKTKFITHFKKLFSGGIYSIKEVLHDTFRHLEIKSDVDELIEVDGEIVGTTPMEMEVIPCALRVVVGQIER